VEPAQQVAAGSYLVFRKLAQDVSGFQAAIQHLARLTGQDEEYAYAMVMGRFRDGTPLAVSQVAQGHNERIPNNFNFHGDPAGTRVPLQAHIRRMNPRGDYPREYHMPLTYERGHRIVRRNVSYGSESNVGTLFACYQCDIRQQYEFLQYNWANQPQVRSLPAGVDTIIGQGSTEQDPAAHHWSTASGAVPFSFQGFVTCRGGEYFFVPSLPFLQAL
jgi:deferrochelatase/peroxidase EfeB